VFLGPEHLFNVDDAARRRSLLPFVDDAAWSGAPPSFGDPCRAQIREQRVEPSRPDARDAQSIDERRRLNDRRMPEEDEAAPRLQKDAVQLASDDPRAVVHQQTYEIVGGQLRASLGTKR
jgi:hypothetical protein